MKKSSLYVAVLSLAMLSSCSTMRNAGDLEFLNDLGSGAESTREAFKSLDKTMNVLGYGSRNNFSTSRINTGYGNAKSTYGYYKGRKIEVTDVPYMVQEVQDFFRYIR